MVQEDIKISPSEAEITLANFNKVAMRKLPELPPIHFNHEIIDAARVVYPADEDVEGDNQLGEGELEEEETQLHGEEFVETLHEVDSDATVAGGK